MVFDLHLGPGCATETVTHPTDICKFLSGDKTTICDFAFFDRAKFPPPTSITQQDKFLHIRRALEQSAIQGGFELITEGSPTKKAELAKRKHPMGTEPPSHALCFRCSHFRRHRKRNKAPSEEDLPIRKASLHNDRSLNTRGHLGKKGPRRTSANTSTSAAHTCPFQFSIILCDAVCTAFTLSAGSPIPIKTTLLISYKDI